MKLLIIDEEFPFPLNTGKRIRSFNLARVLSRTHEVSYLAYGREGTPEFAHLKASGLRPAAVDPPDRRQNGPGFYLKLLVNLASTYPYIVTSHYTRRFQARLDRLIGHEKFDCLICEWTPYARFIENITGIKKVIVAHNVESAIWRGYLANETNPLRRFYIQNQIRKVVNFERRCFSWADGATAVSRGDAQRIESLGLNYPVEVIDNGVDMEYFQPGNEPIDRDLMVFTGSMDWRPNQDAAAYFAHEIFPLIRRIRPNAKAFFVGRNPGNRVMELAKIEGITITGTVDDVRPYIARAGVYVVPLRIGGGSRLKIIEALAMRKAVVSTAVGAEGLRVSDGKNIIIRDTPADFAKATLACLENEELTSKLAQSGYETVMEYYRWEKLGSKFGEYICRIIRGL